MVFWADGLPANNQQVSKHIEFFTEENYIRTIGKHRRQAGKGFRINDLGLKSTHHCQTLKTVTKCKKPRKH
jgi:hypothetical protein